ncbi:MAG: hypothetical protein SGBAC_000299 [Bacillariaceae sp.]
MEKEGTNKAVNPVAESTEGSMNRKSKEQKEKEWKEARNTEEKEKSRKKDAEDQRSREAGDQPPGQVEETVESLIPLKDDPEYAKYFKMLKLGMPLAQVEHAMKRDEKDPLVLKLNPERSLEEQIPEQPEIHAEDVALREDPEYEKYFKMLKMGLPKGAVKNALIKDGKDPSIIDLDPKKSLGSQLSRLSGGEDPPLKEDPDYQKYFKMLKMGMPLGAVKNALVRDGKDPTIIDLDPGKSLKSQIGPQEDAGVALEDDPEYTKYFKMISMGLPVDAVKNALTRDGKDPGVMDLDPSKSVQFQLGKNGKKDTGVPLKDDPEYAKYFKMLGMGLPLGAVKNAFERDGKDPSVLDLDPDKSVAYQLKESAASKRSSAKKKKRVRRKKIYWNPIDPGKLNENSMWNIVRGAVNMNKLNYDQKEFEELFTESADPKDAKKAKKKEKSVKKLVQVIDPKRSMNGGIILARLKIDYSKIADIVNRMERSKFDSTQLSALKEFLADPDERRGLIGYMQNSKIQKEALYADLSETEKYMYTMIDVAGASDKMDAILFRCVFKNRFDDVNAGINILNSACDQLRSSEKLRKLMAMILTVVNQINTGGEGNMAIGFTLDALLKLNEAKAFDKKTSVLHYVVKLVKKNDSRLLAFSSDISFVIPAESVLLDSLANEVKTLGQELVGVHKTVQAEANRLEEAGELRPMTLEDLKEQRTTVRQVGKVSQFNKMDHHTGRTPMERFTVNAQYSCDQATTSIEDVRKKFLAVLQYFGEDENMATGDFFGILRRFMREFQKAVDQVEAIEKKEAKERKRAAARAAKAAAKHSDKLSVRAQKGQHGGKAKLSTKASGKKLVNMRKNRDFGAATTIGVHPAIESTSDNKQQTRSDLLSAMAAAAASRKGLQSGGKRTSESAQAKQLYSDSSSGSVQTKGIDEKVLENQEIVPVTSRTLKIADASKSPVDLPYTQGIQSNTDASHQNISSDVLEKSRDAMTNASILATKLAGRSATEENNTLPSVDSPRRGTSRQREGIVNEQSDVSPSLNSHPVQKSEDNVKLTNSTEQEHGEDSLDVLDGGKIDIELTEPQQGMETFVEENLEAKVEQSKDHLSSRTNTINAVNQREPTSVHTEAAHNAIEFVAGTPINDDVQKEQGVPHPVPSQRKPQIAKIAMKESTDDTTKVTLNVELEQISQFRAAESALKDVESLSIHVIESSDSRETQEPTVVKTASVSEPRSEGISAFDIKLDKDIPTDPSHQPDTSSRLKDKTSSPSSVGTNDSTPMKEQRRPISTKASIVKVPLSGQLARASSSIYHDNFSTLSHDNGEASQRNNAVMTEEVHSVSENSGRAENDKSKKVPDNIDDVSLEDSVAKEAMEVRMSKTWTEGEDITNWMPWADEVLKACDSDSVVGFELPRDLNDGAEFDDDSTIASSTSFASYYDDLSVASGFNTPGKGAPFHRPTTSPFDPYLDDSLQFPNQFTINTGGRLASSSPFDDSRSPTANLSHPPLSGGTSTPRDDVGLDSGLAFGADVGFDDGLGGFGAISNVDNNEGNGRDNSKAATESKRKNAWFPWGGGGGGN